MRAAPVAALAIAAVLSAVSSTEAQQLYRWVDKEGRVHFTQHPPPRDAAKSVEQRKMNAPQPPDSMQMPFALQQAVRNFPVVLYTSPTCKGCDEARDLLAKRGVPNREVSVNDPKSIDVLKGATGDDKVPALTIGRQVHKGFQAGSIHDLLDSAGYPRTPSGPVKPPAPPAEAAAKQSQPAAKR